MYEIESLHLFLMLNVAITPMYKCSMVAIRIPSVYTLQNKLTTTTKKNPPNSLSLHCNEIKRDLGLTTVAAAPHPGLETNSKRIQKTYSNHR